jgi:predicted N-acetyltransferase YhbS
MQVRNLQLDDIEFACRCTELEGWKSEARSEFEACLEYDPLGGFVAQESCGPVGLCVSVSYGAVGFLGELVVLPSWRRRGIGSALFEHALNYLKDQGCRNTFLDADKDAIPLYERFGFRKLFRRPRFAGLVPPASGDAARGMRPEDLPQVELLDRNAFGADRSFFLRRNFALYPELCSILEQGGQVLGYVMGHLGSGCVALGPWIASPALDRPGRLIEGLGPTLRGTRVTLGVLESNPRAVPEVRKLGLEEAPGETWRMVCGPADHLEDEGWVLAVGSPGRG